MEGPSTTRSLSLLCRITSNSLVCNNSHNQESLDIPLDDIICVVPQDNNCNSEYVVLYLQSKDNNNLSQNLNDLICLSSVRIRSPPPGLLSPYLCSKLPHHLDSCNNKDLSVHVIISTLSGTGMAKTVFTNTLKQLLQHIGVDKYEIHETWSARTITEICHSTFIPNSKQGIPQTIILMSGDGGLCDIIDAFYKTAEVPLLPPSISLIPVGTGNAMASSLGLLDHPRAALMSLLHGKPAPIPAFAATFSTGARYVTNEGQDRVSINECSDLTGIQNQRIYGGVVASWGIHATLVADSDTLEYRKFGADRFKIVAKELLFPSKGDETHIYRGEITLFKQNSQTADKYIQKLKQEEHMYVLATMVSNLERDFMISPQTVPLDGSLRMIHFSPMPPQKVMQILTSAYQKGSHIHHEGVLYADIEGFKVDFLEMEETWRRVCIDGKVVAIEEGGWVEVHKEQRRLLNIVHVL